MNRKSSIQARSPLERWKVHARAGNDSAQFRPKIGMDHLPPNPEHGLAVRSNAKDISSANPLLLLARRAMPHR